LVPGFEDNLIGMKKEETKEFTLKFPKDYHKKDFQGKEVLFKVTVRRIEEGKKPELNEELVEKITGKKLTVEEFKADIEGNIKAHKEEQSKQERENKYLEELLKTVDVEIPEALISEEVHFMIEDLQHDMEHRGIPFDKYLEQAKLTHEDLHKKYEAEAEKRVKLRMGITKVIELENIEVTDDEIKAEIEKLIEYYPEDQKKKIKKDLEGNEETNRMKNKMLLKKFFEKVLA
ncbi:MAG TPA: trigger factor, partial [Candidatus Gracilibacteria bacterium]|nr:trigger factor [Candidatus Gracilibacteria bacterium]